MKIALLGTGFGQAHAAVYAARTDVEVVMFGRDPDKTAKVAGQFGFAACTDIDNAFDDDSFDLVDICLPVALHADHVLRALQADKHALVELPLADNLTDAQRVVEAAERSDRQVFVDMFERFIPANRALLDAVRDGTYGRLEQLTLWNLTAHLWPGASLGLKALPLEAMHSDMDIITRTLGLPHELERHHGRPRQRQRLHRGDPALRRRIRPRLGLLADADVLGRPRRLHRHLQPRRPGIRLHDGLRRQADRRRHRLHRRRRPPAPAANRRPVHRDDRPRPRGAARRRRQPDHPGRTSRRPETHPRHRPQVNG